MTENLKMCTCIQSFVSAPHLALTILSGKFSITEHALSSVVEYFNFLSAEFSSSLQDLHFHQVMYQLIPSLTIPPGQTPRKFLEGRIPHPRAQRKCETPATGQKNRAKTHPWRNYFQKSIKNTKHETEIMKNGTEMLTCLEILKQWNI